MANDRPPVHKFTSPKGTFVFPKLDAPDTKWKPEGEYSVKLALPADAAETQTFIGKLNPFYTAAIVKAEAEFAKLPVGSRKKLGSVKPNEFFSTEFDKDTEEPTGRVLFAIKMKASGVTKAGKAWSRKPTIFDARGKVLSPVPPIWGGTVGRVAFEVVEGGYFVPGSGACGISLSLTAAQIIELRSGAQRDAKGYGFGEEEGFEQESFPEHGIEDSAAVAADEQGDF